MNKYLILKYKKGHMAIYSRKELQDKVLEVIDKWMLENDKVDTEVMVLEFEQHEQ